MTLVVSAVFSALALSGPEDTKTAAGPIRHVVLVKFKEGTSDETKKGIEGAFQELPKKIDATYIDNAAQAHLDALDRVAPGAPCAGRAYFISNDAPWVLDEVINAMLYAAGMEPQKRRISFRAAHAIGRVCETVWGTLRLRSEPPMTRFLAEQLSTAHWFDISAAKRDLGYQAKVSMGEGFGRLAEWWKRSVCGAGHTWSEWDLMINRFRFLTPLLSIRP